MQIKHQVVFAAFQDSKKVGGTKISLWAFAEGAEELKTALLKLQTGRTTGRIYITVEVDEE